MLWDPRRARSDAAPSAGGAALADDGQQVPTKALRKFLTSLRSREAPVLLDLGPVVGSNVAFFGERLGCKILIEDVFDDLDRHLRAGTKPFAEVLDGRLKHPAESVDGILAWNLFDYLDPPSARVLAGALMKLLRPDGALLGFFATVPIVDTRFKKYVIADEDTLHQKPYSGGGKRQAALPNRDIIRLFEGLKVSESFLLKTNIREFLFRKSVVSV